VFTGIVEEIGRVGRAGEGSLIISAKRMLEGLAVGDSLAVNGVCLTVTRFDVASFSVSVMPETRRRTNLGELGVGDRVNLERALAFGGRLGGHLVQGHVDEVGRVVTLSPDGEALAVNFAAPPQVMEYIVPQGFIAVDGVSLTVVSREADSFRVSLVGYTRDNTTLGGKQAGAAVNLEVDIIAKYVAQFTRQERPEKITAAFLAEHGFISGSRTGLRGG
jgi:riboflavin synthase